MRHIKKKTPKQPLTVSLLKSSTKTNSEIQGHVCAHLLCGFLEVTTLHGSGFIIVWHLDVKYRNLVLLNCHCVSSSPSAASFLRGLDKWQVVQIGSGCFHGSGSFQSSASEVFCTWAVLIGGFEFCSTHWNW